MWQNVWLQQEILKHACNLRTPSCCNTQAITWNKEPRRAWKCICTLGVTVIAMSPSLCKPCSQNCFCGTDPWRSMLHMFNVWMFNACSRLGMMMLICLGGFFGLWPALSSLLMSTVQVYFMSETLWQFFQIATQPKTKTGTIHHCRIVEHHNLFTTALFVNPNVLHPA